MSYYFSRHFVIYLVYLASSPISLSSYYCLSTYIQRSLLVFLCGSLSVSLFDFVSVSLHVSTSFYISDSKSLNLSRAFLLKAFLIDLHNVHSRKSENKMFCKKMGGRHSSVVSSAPTILRPRVRIPSTPSKLFSICIEIVTRKERK